MDATDISLIMLLSANSRLPYADLAEHLNLSVNAVHKRIQQLIDLGIIRAFTAKVSLNAAHAVVVFISGTSHLPSFKDLPDRLKAQGSIYWLAIGGGKYLYIGAYLKDLTNLPAFTAYIQQETQIPEPTIGLMAFPAHPPGAATPMPSDLDLRIINSLKDNARKPLSDVAAELNVSTKTIRRRLTHMTTHTQIELSIEWYPDKTNDIMTLIDLHLTPGTSPAIANTLVKKYAPAILFYWAFANLPTTITLAAWTNTMNDLQTLRANLEKEPGIASVVPNILFTGYIFPTWRDHLSLPHP